MTFLYFLSQNKLFYFIIYYNFHTFCHPKEMEELEEEEEEEEEEKEEEEEEEEEENEKRVRFWGRP